MIPRNQPRSVRPVSTTGLSEVARVSATCMRCQPAVSCRGARRSRITHSASERAFLEPWTWENRKSGLHIAKPHSPTPVLCSGASSRSTSSPTDRPGAVFSSDNSDSTRWEFVRSGFRVDYVTARVRCILAVPSARSRQGHVAWSNIIVKSANVDSKVRFVVKIHRLHDSALIVQPVYSGIIGCGRANQYGGIIDRWQAAQYLREVLGTNLAGSAAATCHLGQGNCVGHFCDLSFVLLRT